MEDIQILQVLLKNPKKKYLRKLLDYTVGIINNREAIPEYYSTPLSEALCQTLQLTSQETHQVILALQKLIKQCMKKGFTNYDNIFPQSFDPQLAETLIDLISNENFQQMLRQTNFSNLKQGNQLIDIDWKVEMELVNQNGKSDKPIVSISFDTARESMLQTYYLQMNGQQFHAFFGNLKKIKDQLIQLVQPQNN